MDKIEIGGGLKVDSTKSELIRVSRPTKELLSTLKLIEGESFDSVINRLLQTKIEDCIHLNNQTQQLLRERLDNVAQGKVMSSKELLEKVKSMTQKSPEDKRLEIHGV